MNRNEIRKQRRERYELKQKMMGKEEVENIMPYLKEKTSILDSKIKDKDLTNEKNINGIIEGIIDTLHEIDDYLPAGIDDSLNSIKEHGLDSKNILNFLIPLVNVFNYWKYLTNKYHRKQTNVLEENLISNVGTNEQDKANAHDKVVEKLNSLDKPKYSDLVPLAIISIATAYAKPPYGSLAGVVLSQFTILK